MAFRFTLCCAIGAFAVAACAAAQADSVQSGEESSAAATCPPPGGRAQVTRIYRVTWAGMPEVVRLNAKPQVDLGKVCAADSGDAGSPGGLHFKLRDTIAMCVSNLSTLRGQMDCANKSGGDRKLVLFLNGLPLPDIASYPPTDPESNLLMFKLERTEHSRDVWTSILGKPGWNSRETLVSVGLSDGHAVASAGYIQFDVLPHGWMSFWFFLFVVLLIGFLLLAVKTDVLRDSGSVQGVVARKRFSLARSQAAWWFFLVLAAYLFIGIVTADFSTSITTTALTLLGISAGTTVGSAFIDASRSTPEDRRVEDAASTSLQTEMPQIDAVLGQAKAQLAAAPNDAALAASVAVKEAERAIKVSQLRKLRNQSEDFLRDVLSDANGVNFHRFQILAWTIVLGIIFIVQVFQGLAMPEFSGTLLGLMGISAGTYLGLKIPEDTVPTK